MEKPTFRTYHFDEFQLDLKRGCLLDGELRTIELKPKAFEVLKYLCENPRTLIKRADLVREVWRDVTVSEDSAKECIYEIRQALGEKGKTIIYTKHGFQAYRFDCDVKERKDIFGKEEGTVDAGITDELNIVQEPDEELARSDDLPDEPRADPFIVQVEVPAEKETEKGPLSAEELVEETQTASDVNPDKHGLQEGDRNSTSARDDSDDTSSNGSETFERWLSGPGLRISLTLLACVVATFVLSVAVVNKGGTPGNADAMQVISANAMRAASAAQCLVILLMFLHSWFWTEARGFLSNKECGKAAIVKAGFKNETEFKDERASLETSLNKYTRYWRGLLLSWVPLYFVYALVESNSGKILTVVFNVGNTLMVVACFNSLNKHVDEQDREHLPGWVLNAGLLVVLVGVLIALLLTKHPDAATLLAGIIAGITMALYIGRLQSRFLGPRFLILYLLYSYTAIQPLVLYIRDHPEWGWIILNFALLLKCLLYIYMIWLFQSGLLLFYFASVKRTDSAVRQQWKAFRELLSKHPLK